MKLVRRYSLSHGCLLIRLGTEGQNESVCRIEHQAPFNGSTQVNSTATFKNCSEHAITNKRDSRGTSTAAPTKAGIIEQAEACRLTRRATGLLDMNPDVLFTILRNCGIQDVENLLNLFPPTEIRNKIPKAPTPSDPQPPFAWLEDTPKTAPRWPFTNDQKIEAWGCFTRFFQNGFPRHMNIHGFSIPATSVHICNLFNEANRPPNRPIATLGLHWTTNLDFQQWWKQQQDGTRTPSPSNAPVYRSRGSRAQTLAWWFFESLESNLLSRVVHHSWGTFSFNYSIEVRLPPEAGGVVLA